MASHAFYKVTLICSLLIFQIGVEGGRWNISAEEDLVFERRLKLLNKPALKTIKTDHGDMFDCVDFYKQPAFDHPLLKDYQVDFDPFKASKLLKKTLDHVVPNKSEDALKYTELKDGGCPIGTVPIRRITKEDLIREKLATDVRPRDINSVPGAQYAVVKTQQDTYNAASAIGSIYQPGVSGQQYSAGRIKIFRGADSLELGWRVDPLLYGDTESRFYIRTDAGQTHCFDARCPGFVVVDRSIPLGGSLEVSERGGTTAELALSFNRDISNGNWWVEVKDTRIGFWPQQLFTGPADNAEWGGEVFGPPGAGYPAMGAGFYPTSPDTRYDAHFSNIEIRLGEIITDPVNMRVFDGNYKATDEGYTGEDFKHMMFFGGPAS